MGSTLRSLVLRYKADLKDFQKGNRRVIDDIKASKREIVSLDKEMKKAFTPKVDAARNQIKRLNEQFRAGKMDVQKYGTAVDTLKQKIAAMNRVSAITAHEVGALRGRRVAAANANKALKDSFTGTPGGLSIAQMLASAPERQAATAGGGVRSLAAMGNFGSIGKIAKVAGPVAAMTKMAWAVGSRGSELADGGQSRVLGSYSKQTGDSFRGARALASDVKEGFIDGLTGGVATFFDALTLGGVSRHGKEVKRLENWQRQDDENRRFAYAKKRAMDEAESPIEEFRKQQEINNLFKERGMMGLEQAAETARRAAKENDLLRVNHAIAAAMQDQVNAAEAATRAAKARKQAIADTLVDAAKELRIQQDIDKGMTEGEARMKAAGGTSGQIGFARMLDKDMEKLLRDRTTVGGDPFGLLGEGGGIDRMIADARAKANQVSGFADQFATPQELFAKNLKEIQSMLSLGLDPAIAHRAMMQNASGLAGSENRLSRFAPAAEVGSREEMALREGAKAQSKQDKKLGELVEIQKQALQEAKKNGGEIKVNLTEVNI